MDLRNQRPLLDFLLEVPLPARSTVAVITGQAEMHMYLLTSQSNNTKIPRHLSHSNVWLLSFLATPSACCCQCMTSDILTFQTQRATQHGESILVVTLLSEQTMVSMEHFTVLQ